MLASRTFKQELIEFRATCRASADRDMLDRWTNWEFESEWRKIKKQAPKLSAGELIRAALLTRRSAAASVNREFGVPASKFGWKGRTYTRRAIPGFRTHWAAFLPLLKYRLSNIKDTAQALDVAEMLESAATEVRDLHRYYFGHADQVSFPLSRQGSNTDRSRRAFWELLATYFQKKCGGQRYGTIAVLSEIAFPGKTVDLTDVKDWLRRRPGGHSTRKKRQ